MLIPDVISFFLMKKINFSLDSYLRAYANFVFDFGIIQMYRAIMRERTKLKIGVFSKLMQVTVKTLRHYEQKGLLLPCEVDRWTGYRYYSIEQMQRLITTSWIFAGRNKGYVRRRDARAKHRAAEREDRTD